MTSLTGKKGRFDQNSDITRRVKSPGIVILSDLYYIFSRNSSKVTPWLPEVRCLVNFFLPVFSIFVVSNLPLYRTKALSYGVGRCLEWGGVGGEGVFVCSMSGCLLIIMPLPHIFVICEWMAWRSMCERPFSQKKYIKPTFAWAYIF